MLHITLNTGHKFEQRDRNPEVAALMRPLLGGGSLGMVAPELSPFRVEIARTAGSAIFTVFRASAPIVSSMVCWDAAASQQAWTTIESLYLTISDRHPDLIAANALPEKPASTPWLACVILPALIVQPGDTARWLGDFERCMAWAILPYENET